MSTIRPKPHQLSDSGSWTSPSINPAAPSPERLLWIGFDRSTTVTDARWARQAAGIDVQVVRTVAQAMASCEKAHPMALVIEFELADGEDGVQALEQLRAQGVHAPVVMITATPELAICRLARSRLDEVVPVFGRLERYDRLREWLDQLRMCLAMLA